MEIRSKSLRKTLVRLILVSACAWPGLAIAGSLATSESDKTFTGHELAKQAAVHLLQARAIALKVRSGEITDEELESESGGSGLRYSFDIKAAGVVYEVGVDAKSGKVLENSPEGKNPD